MLIRSSYAPPLRPWIVDRLNRGNVIATALESLFFPNTSRVVPVRVHRGFEKRLVALCLRQVLNLRISRKRGSA